MEPEVCSGNDTAWSLYQLFDSQWDWGGAGYRTRYDYGPLMVLARSLGSGGAALLDLVERVKVIEATILEIESQRYEFDQSRRERERRFSPNRNRKTY